MVYKTIQFCGPHRGQRSRSPGLGNRNEEGPGAEIHSNLRRDVGNELEGRGEGRDMADVWEFTEADALSKELSSTFSCSRSSRIIGDAVMM
jgi:hypothetical protein